MSLALHFKRNIVYKRSNMENGHFSISMDHPCHEDWGSMTIVNGGRHCALCRKTVIDFTGQSNREIFSYFKSNPGPICGRFTEGQLDQAMPLLPEDTGKKPLPRMVAVLLLVPCLWTQHAKAQISHKAAVETTLSMSKGNKKIKLKGIIRDEISQKPLYGMEIRIEGFGSRYSNARVSFPSYSPTASCIRKSLSMHTIQASLLKRLARRPFFLKP